MRCEAAIVLARQLAKQPILRARTGSGHLLLLVAVASLAGGTNGAERLRRCRRDRQEMRVYAAGAEYTPNGTSLGRPRSTRWRKAAGRTPFVQRRSTRRPRPRGPPDRGP